jgi:hypothetical protein
MAPGHDGGATPFGEDMVTSVQPYQARKRYVCPGCSTWIEPGVGHVVVVPERAADLRRHWHHGCWWKEQRRLGPSAETGSGSVEPVRR